MKIVERHEVRISVGGEGPSRMIVINDSYSRMRA